MSRCFRAQKLWRITLNDIEIGFARGPVRRDFHLKMEPLLDDQSVPVVIEIPTRVPPPRPQPNAYEERKRKAFFFGRKHAIHPAMLSPYAPWSIQISHGCEFGCVLCEPRCRSQASHEEWDQPRLFDQNLDMLTADLKRGYRTNVRGMNCITWKPGDRALLCDKNDAFTVAVPDELIRRELALLHEYKFDIMLRTRSLRPLDFIPEMLAGNARLGIVLTPDCPNLLPGTPPLEDRIRILQEAHQAGIWTWASLTPILPLLDYAELIERIKPYLEWVVVDKPPFGMDMSKQISSMAGIPRRINWEDMRRDMIDILDRARVPFYLMPTLREYPQFTRWRKWVNPRLTDSLA